MSPFDQQSDKTLPPLAGQRLARGVARALRGLDFVTLEEMIPTSGLRVDLMALGPKGEVWVIECKSGPADFRADQKWKGYLEFCDRFFWAVDANFPTDMLPAETGLILADAYDAEIARPAALVPLATARRKTEIQRLARLAMRRLMKPLPCGATKVRHEQLWGSLCELPDGVNTQCGKFLVGLGPNSVDFFCGQRPYARR